MFEELVGVVDGFTLLADKYIEFLGAHWTLKCVAYFPYWLRPRHVMPHGGLWQYRCCRVIGEGFLALVLRCRLINRGYGAWAALVGWILRL